LLVRGDHDLNEVKAGKLELGRWLGFEGWFPLRDRERNRRALWLQAGLPGPRQLLKPVKVVADRTVAAT
jgi:prolyl-tRNA synthetase